MPTSNAINPTLDAVICIWCGGEFRPSDDNPSVGARRTRIREHGVQRTVPALIHCCEHCRQETPASSGPGWKDDRAR